MATRLRVFRGCFDLAAAATVLFSAAGPALYQFRISYRDPWLLEWLIGGTAVLVAMIAGARWIVRGRRGVTPAFPLRPAHLLQLATLTATTALAVSLLAPINTIQTSGVPPQFGPLYLAIHGALAVVLLVRARPGSSFRESVLLLLLLSTLNGRLFSADYTILLALLLSALLARIDEEPALPAPQSLLQTSLLALLAFAALGTLAAEEVDASWAVLVRFGFLVGLFLAVGAYVRGVEDARRVLATLLAGGALVGAFALIPAFLALENATPRAVLNTRFALFNAHPNLLGPNHAVAAVLALGLAIAAKSRAWRLLAVAAGILLFGVLAQGASKAALGAFLLGAALFVLFTTRRLRALMNRRALLAACVLVPVAMLAVLAVAPRGMKDRLKLSGIRQTLEYRLDIWRATLRVIADHPFTGVGLENYSLAAAHLQTTTAQDEKRDPHPHNLYLAVALATGLPGFACFALFLAALCVQARRAWLGATTPLEQRLIAIAMAAVLVILAASMLDVGLGLGTFLPGTLLVIAATVSALASRHAPPAGLFAARAAPLSFRPAARAACATGAMLLLCFVCVREGISQHETFEARLAHRAGDIERARELYASARALDPFDRPLTLALVEVYRSAQTGSDAERRGNQEKALSLLQQLSRRTPRDPAIYHRIATLRREMRDPDEAMVAIRRAIDHAPDMVTSAPYYIELGILLWDGLKDLDGTFQALKKALILDIGAVNQIPWEKRKRPDGFDDQLVVIRTVQPDGKTTERSFRVEDLFDSIRGDYERDLAAGATPNVLEWLKLFHMYYNANDFAQAEAVLARIDTFPNFNLVTLDRELGDVSARKGELDAAIEHYTRALSARPNMAMYAGLAEALRKKGEVEEARNNYDRSLSLKEDLYSVADWYGGAYKSLGQLSVELGEKVKAIGYLRRALYFAPNPPERLRLLSQIARLARETGDTDLAVETVDRAADLLALAGLDLVDQGIDNPLRDLASTAARGLDLKSPRDRRWLRDLADAGRRRSSSPALSVLAAYCAFALDDIEGAQVALARSRVQSRINRLADIAGVDLLIAAGRPSNCDPLFQALAQLDVTTRMGDLQRSRLMARYSVETAARGVSKDLHVMIGDFYLLSGKFTEAAMQYKPLAAAEDADARSLARLGRALFFLGERTTAGALFQKAAALDPFDPFLELLARGCAL